MQLKSSNIEPHFTLARLRPPRLRQFLLEFANLQLFTQGATLRFARKFPEFFPDAGTIELRLFKAKGIETPDAFLEKWLEIVLHSVREQIQMAWQVPDQRIQEWCIFEARRYFWIEASKSLQLVATATEAGSAGPLVTVAATTSPVELPTESGWPYYHPDQIAPPLTAFEQAMAYLHAHIHQALRCPNPDCPAKHFLADRKNQKYCSEHCAGIAQRESKKRWWRQEGRKRRKPKS